jgi:hypothetical protein
VFEDSSLVRRVERVWYHPRLNRDFDFGLSATSFDARDGPISLAGPDLAIVQLAEGGEELRDGCDAKLDDEDSTLAQGRAVGLIGYWADEYSAWPTAVRPAKANFATSAVGPAYALGGSELESIRPLWLHDVEKWIRREPTMTNRFA